MKDHTLILSRCILEIATDKQFSKETVQAILDYQYDGYSQVHDLNNKDNRVILCINFVMNQTIRNIRNVEQIDQIYGSLFLHLEDILEIIITHKEFYIDLMKMLAVGNGQENMMEYDSYLTKNLEYAEKNMTLYPEVIYQLYTKQLNGLVNSIDFTDDIKIEELRVLDYKIRSMSEMVTLDDNKKLYIVF